MALQKVTYTDGVTVIFAQNLNDIQDAIIALQSGGGSGVTSVNGKTGVVVLTASDVGAGTYSKPSGGIPKTDLASAVQTSLGKADTALQPDNIDQSLDDHSDNPVANWVLEGEISRLHSDKLDKDQGVAHAGEFCVVGSDGNITTVTMTAWQGGSY
jgi:hypothetical protein